MSQTLGAESGIILACPKTQPTTPTLRLAKLLPGVTQSLYGDT